MLATLKAKSLMTEFLELAGIEDGVYYTSEHGIYTYKGMVHLTERGVGYTVGGITQHFDNVTLTCKLVKLITCPTALNYHIKYSIIGVLKQAGCMSDSLVLTFDVDFNIEGNRIIIQHDNNVYRINVETMNVTKLINWEWIIQSQVTESKINDLHAILHQVNLM